MGVASSSFILDFIPWSSSFPSSEDEEIIIQKTGTLEENPRHSYSGGMIKNIHIWSLNIFIFIVDYFHSFIQVFNKFNLGLKFSGR